MAKKNREPLESWYQPRMAPVCPLCEREIPPEQKDEHHLVPRLKGGKETQALHRICHRQIHALFTEAELAQKYSSADALLEHPDIQTFVQWVKKKPPGFYEAVRMSNRKR